MILIPNLYIPSTSRNRQTNNFVIGLLFVAVGLTSSCQQHSDNSAKGMEVDASAEKFEIVGTWKCPAPKEWRWREDGEGPYPKPGPMGAVVVKGPDQPKQHSVLSNATLFLLAGQKLDLSDPVTAIVNHTRYADVCSTVEMRGHWIEFIPKGRRFFSLIYESGGTAGPTIEVFKHELLYEPHETPNEYQSHFFRKVFTGNSRIAPYVADVDGDGGMELIIASETTNSSGAPDTPQVYWILKWDREQNKMKRTGEISADRLKSKIKDVIPL
ncbi:MAG: hypothetical protein MI923_05970 [Phycisphaerales bacterium]|nr:hypothetical protein [Phycisphaerales bacterium]